MQQAGAFGTFLKRFIKDPKNIGAICPSSRYLAKKMCQSVDWTANVRIVEYGAGTGPFTLEIQNRLNGGRHLAIERDPVFVEMLRDRFPKLEITDDGVENLIQIAGDRNLLPVDHIISGLPFASLPGELTTRILHATHQALKPGGTFTTFQYVHAYGFRAAKKFRAQMEDVFGPLRKRNVEFRNIPPAYIFTWRKP